MSLRDQLRARERPQLDYELPVGDVASANRALAGAEVTLRQAQGRLATAEAARVAATAAEDAEAAAAATAEAGAAQAAVEAAREDVEQAKAGLAACFAHVILTAMPPDDYEALLALHPPREGSGDKKFDSETFPRVCFLACATELSPEEWEPILRDNMSWAERDDMFYLATVVNERLVNAALPKDSMRTRSS